MRELYAHQEAAIDRIPPSGGYLAFEQGLGKTLTAIEWARKNDYFRILVVCPAIAIGVWEQELEAEGRISLVPTGTRREKARQMQLDYVAHYTVINYEVLLEPAVEKAIKFMDYDLIILDEAQKIKTATAKRSKVLHRLGKDIAVLALSGTPVTKNLLDLYSQYKTIDPGIWGGISWTKFKQKYANWGGYGGYELLGYRNVDELKDLIRPLTVVAKKEDTLDLPEKTHINIPVPMGKHDSADYGRMAREGVARDWVTTTPLERLLRLSQIAGGAKLASTAEFVESLVDNGEQVVVYYRFREEGRQLSHRLGVEDLNGSTPAARRRSQVDDFQAGQSQIFLAQITAGSTAITLTNASHMVYHSLSYAYEDWAQSQDRIHRIGQGDPCFYYYMVARGPKGGITVDDLVLNALQNKDDIAGMVTRDPSLLLPKEPV